MDQSYLDNLVSRAIGEKNIAGAVLYVSSGSGTLDLISAAGNFSPDSRYYIASINKLFMSSIILKLAGEKKLNLKDRLAEHIADEFIQDLHIYKSTDYSGEITLFHMISQTSGLPDYLAYKQENGNKVITELVAGIDQAWPVEKVISTVKKMRPHFPPGTPGKARYIDTNHQILELVIENVTGNPVEKVLDSLFTELNMTETYVCTDINDRSFIPVRYKDEMPDISRFLTSTKNDIISTARDQMKFIKAFFNGKFYPAEKLMELEKWNRVFFPFSYGVGIQKFSLPRFMTLLLRIPPLIGHGGSTGSVAFHNREKDLYFTGTVNQQAGPGVMYQMMLKALKKAAPKR